MSGMNLFEMTKIAGIFFGITGITEMNCGVLSVWAREAIFYLYF